MNAISEAGITEWQSAIGRAENIQQILELESLRRYALAIGADPDVERVLPPLAHWAFFLPASTDGDIGEDGHPRRGGFLPAIPLPRRMFAAASIAFKAPLELGAPASLTSSVAQVTHKSGRSGDLIFVEVDRLLEQAGVVRVSERQSYVYRGEGGPVPMPEAAANEPEGERWHPAEVNLFRFSAATFNGHRIHYDRAYATGVEGYPSLVIHGPLTAAKLAGLAMRTGPIKSFSFRAQAPLFLGQSIFLQTGEADEVCAVRCDGTTGMTAKVTR
ncbi:hypothetical protein KRZ98_07360 [Sphingobium sp. AS12]|uniref:hypothetical protein n=1 Tax=Sphingobium sp. AS12 TaxID=2849495 RepID=UPI001C31B6D0|nr:hypothetical protein [Sphingobium sp. AS12]MBV2148101.1 hypothetical protein [Sphingobium sp. AS12]